MKNEDAIVGEKYRGINPLAVGCTYEILKKNKVTCWVKVWDDDIETRIIYKNVGYGALIKKQKREIK